MSLGGSQTTTTTTQQPAWLQSAMQQNISRAGQIANQPYQRFPGPRIADFTQDQQNAFALTRQSVGQSAPAFDEARDFLRTSAQGVNPERISAATMQAPQLASAMGYNAATGADAMGAYDNPFTSQVIDRAMGDLNRAEDRQLSQARRRAAGNNSFGGSRTAILEGEIMRGFNDQRGDVASRLRSEGFNTALQAGQTDAGRMSDARRFAAEMGNNFALQQAGMDMEAAGANMGAENQSRQFNATQGLEAQLANRAAAAGAGTQLASIEGADRNARNIQGLTNGVTVTEPAGADTFVTMTLSGKDCIARMRADADVHAGQPFELAVNMDKAVLFDPKTEERIG